ncbi:MAG: ATP-dependent DNA helicase [Spirochaetaceae bacterium]|nr:ATP-dependent DNA helicase [Spirochaetaceae bacterium]
MTGETVRPSLRELLAAAVEAIGGIERPGQVAMAEAVQRSMNEGRHLLVQAGTGTGKSLAYLVPALLHDDTVVVATATIALQSQVVDRDLPALADAVEPLLGRRPTYAILKGRSNYLCRNRVFGGMPDDAEDALFDPSPTTDLGRDVVRLREWAEETPTGDRDELEPGVTDRAWRQVSVSARECLGAAKCPFGAECFAELARARAGAVDIVVTNHALLAIDALEGFPVLPEHDVVVVDEAHELVDRVTGVATDELIPAMVDRAAARARRIVDDSSDLADAGDALLGALAVTPEGRVVDLPEQLAAALALVRDAARDVLSEIGRAKQADDGARKVAQAAVGAVFDTAERLAAHSPYDVTWTVADARRGPSLRVAPLAVNGLLREALFGERSVVLTSATIELGGSFEPIARQVGLTGEDAPEWEGLDVGSPFDYPTQGILYVARRLPPPGRDGASPAAMDELAALIEAAGGRTLGLFSSMRAAQVAAEEMRSLLDVPVLCQGEDRTGALVRAFADDPATCLFGTLSLWQGVDVPGEACQLVVIDRIPFPRPDDPLMSARSQAVADAGGNGFMSVAATHAALMLAQGAGRLIRSSADRGVVAVLDSRLATARYASFLRSSLPPFWFTTDRDVALGALRRLAAAAPSGDDAAAETAS